MSVQFIPPSGSTIAFGNVVVGSNASQTWTVKQTGANAYYQTDSIVMSGVGASQFSASDPGPLYGTDSNSAGIGFAPTSAAAFSVTMTVQYEVGQNGIPNGNVLTLTYTLTGTGIPNTRPPNEVSSLLQAFRYLLVPTQGTTGKVLSFYDTTSFNDTGDASTYVYKMEDIIADRVPTVRRVIVTYIDMGIATLNVAVNAVNDLGIIVNQQATITIGTAGATGLYGTAYADLQVTGYRPQVTLFRAANAGPVFISHVMVSGTVEREVTL